MTMYKEQLEKSLKNIEDYVSDVDKLYVGKCVMILVHIGYWVLDSVTSTKLPNFFKIAQKLFH